MYVDDGLVTGFSTFEIDRVGRFFHDKFTLKDLGEARYFLGLKIACSDQGLYFNQRKYSLDIISDAGLTGAKPATTPFPPGCKLTHAGGTLLDDPALFVAWLNDFYIWVFPVLIWHIACSS